MQAVHARTFRSQMSSSCLFAYTSDMRVLSLGSYNTETAPQNCNPSFLTTQLVERFLPGWPNHALA
jgi:hypothetical protein